MKKRYSLIFVAAAVLGFAAGCHHNSEPAELHGEVIAPDDEPRAEQSIAAAQAAAGARADATLYPAHFDEAGLNSLGQTKIDLMLHDEQAAQPLVVYLDLSDKTDHPMEHQSVMDYIKGRGLPETQIKLVDGPNPRTLHPAAEALSGLAALQQTQATGSSAPAAAPQGFTAPPPAPSTDNAAH